ncbi:SCP-like extracellular protein [Bacillus sp. AFS031507]|nr:SCP-like extracellular protein [Bacillus sp. AFS031507]
MISAYQTNLNSNQYPHTRAVLIQDAKYQFIRLDPRLGNLALQQIQPYIQQQRPNVQAPVQQQPAPIQQQPAPIQQQPAPKQQRPAPPQAQPAPKQPATTQNNAPATGTVSQYVQQVIDLTNAQRSKNGLPALKADTQLNSVAQKKSLDMQQKNYFSHTSPTYGSPFDMMRDFGVTYKSAGENIAQGQRTPQEVVTAWMNSEGHRKNILSSNFTHIGVGFEATGKHWTQMFIGK